MVARRILSRRGATTWVPISFRPARLKTKKLPASRPRFTDAKKPRPSRPWSLNGILSTTRCPPISACRQTAWHRPPQTDQQDHRSLWVEQVNASVGPYPCCRLGRSQTPRGLTIAHACAATQAYRPALRTCSRSGPIRLNRSGLGNLNKPFGGESATVDALTGRRKGADDGKTNKTNAFSGV
jgi:hypothetical protein